MNLKHNQIVSVSTLLIIKQEISKKKQINKCQVLEQTVVET